MPQVYPRRIENESRSTSVRRYQIHQIFLRDGHTNCTKLADELEVGLRTVLRDIDAMRRQNYPIEYDPKRRAYFYTKPVYNLPSVQISEGELLALRVASCALEQNTGTPFHQQLSRIYRILLNGLKDQEVVWERIGSAFSFHHLGVGVVDADVFEKLTFAMLRSLEVEFEYQKPEESKPKSYRVRPYYIANRDNMFYLVAEVNGDKEMKFFAIPRVRGKVSLTGKGFVRDKGHSLSKRFQNAFRILGGEVLRHVKLKIKPRTAPYIRERSWHASQKITELPDGGLILELDLGDLRDMRPWLLRWGSDVEVLQPADLRREIASTARELAKIYC